MIDLTQLEPWHWFIFGVFLMTAEIFLASFTIFWFGLAALVVAVVLWLIAIEATTQFWLWIILSIGITFIWFKYIRPLAIDRTKAGSPRESTIGKTGMVIDKKPDSNEIKVRFALPILGEDEWSCRCLTPVDIGDRVTVTDILGNQFIVTK